mmetsp:Transcript_217/g.445  ORF Transcript_217/g.445 Transcript_217/m.445 type:complete len:218 (-) Transcript_217:205-858(-)
MPHRRVKRGRLLRLVVGLLRLCHRRVLEVLVSGGLVGVGVPEVLVAGGEVEQRAAPLVDHVAHELLVRHRLVRVVLVEHHQPPQPALANLVDLLRPEVHMMQELEQLGAQLQVGQRAVGHALQPPRQHMQHARVQERLPQALLFELVDDFGENLEAREGGLLLLVRLHVRVARLLHLVQELLHRLPDLFLRALRLLPAGFVRLEDQVQVVLESVVVF